MGVYDMKMLKLFDISFLNLYPAVQWTIFKCLFKDVTCCTVDNEKKLIKILVLVAHPPIFSF